MLARRQIATLDIERIPSPGGKDIGLGESAFLDPRGKPTLVADNDDLRTYAVVGPVELSVAPAGQRLAAGSEAQRKRSPWLMMVVASLVFHAAVAAFFLFEMGDESVLIEGGVESEMAANGSASADQVAAGDVVEIEILPVPIVAAAAVAATTAEPVTSAPVAEAVPAEPVESQAVAAAEVPPATAVQQTPEAAQPAETTQAQPSQSEPAPATETETAVATEPEVEILAVSPSDSEPEEAVAAPSSPALVEPAAPTEPVETATAAPVQTEETVAEAANVPIPTPRPAYTPPPEPKKVAENKPKQAKETPKATTRQQTAGSGGKNQADAKRGAADGRAEGKAAASTNGGKRNSAAGNAAVSNYPGKIASKLRRSLRYPAAARREKLRGEVHVSFTVASSGSVASARIARSSGSPVLDQAALETVRRAAPFPPIPDGAGRSSWPFTVPLAFTR